MQKEGYHKIVKIDFDNGNLAEIEVKTGLSMDYAIDLLNRFGKIFNLTFKKNSNLFGGYFYDKNSGICWLVK